MIETLPRGLVGNETMAVRNGAALDTRASTAYPAGAIGVRRVFLIGRGGPRGSRPVGAFAIRRKIGNRVTREEDVEAIGLIVLGFFILLVIAASVGAFFLRVGARMAKIPDVTFGRALAANLAGAVVSTFVGLLLGSVPVFGLILGPIGNIAGYILVVQHKLRTDVWSATVAWLVAMIAQMVAATLVVVVLAGVLGVSLLQFTDLFGTAGQPGM